MKKLKAVEIIEERDYATLQNTIGDFIDDVNADEWNVLFFFQGENERGYKKFYAVIEWYYIDENVNKTLWRKLELKFISLKKKLKKLKKPQGMKGETAKIFAKW